MPGEWTVRSIERARSSRDQTMLEPTHALVSQTPNQKDRAMIRKISRFGLAFALVAFGSPLAASAGAAPITAHPLRMTIKVVAQTVNSNEDQTPDKVTADVKDVFEECRGAPPENDQAVYLFLNCANLNDNTILAIDTDPVAALEEIGSIDFDLVNAVNTTKEGILKAKTLPVDIELTCNGNTAIEVTGIMDLKFSELSPVNACPESGSVKITGVGDTPSAGGRFLVDDGSSISVKKRSASILTVPPLP